MSEPIIERLSHIQGFESNYEFLLELHVLVDGAHSLLTCVSSEVVNYLKVLLLLGFFGSFVFFRILLFKLKLLLLLIVSLFLKNFVITTDHFRLKPSAGVSRLILDFDLELDI